MQTEPSRHTGRLGTRPSAVVAVGLGWLLGAAGGCDSGAAPAVVAEAGRGETQLGADGHSETPRPDADSDVGAEAGPVSAADGGQEAGPAVGCGESPGAVAADWPIPDPTTPGSPRAQSYDTSSAGVVLDRVTHLTWQRHVDPVTRTWREAKQYCACLELGGHDDWRMPSRIELVSIVDFTKNTPSIDSVAFPETPSEWFWTSSTLAANPEEAWYIYFDNGFSKFILAEDFPYRVRCVRSDPPPAPSARYRIEAATVVDNKTGLVWERGFTTTGRPWDAARAYCAQLSVAGGNWRLPSMRELQSLVDETRFDPAIDPAAFPDTPGVEFWTGSPVSGAPGSAWRVSFANGYTYDATVGLDYLARCVK